MTMVWVSLGLSIFGLLCTIASNIMFALNMRRLNR